jgi:hypothetical protein
MTKPSGYAQTRPEPSIFLSLSRVLMCDSPGRFKKFQSVTVCVECLVGKQNELEPTLFKVTEPSSVPYRTPSACAKMEAYRDPPPEREEATGSKKG